MPDALLPGWFTAHRRNVEERTILGQDCLLHTTIGNEDQGWTVSDARTGFYIAQGKSPDAAITAARKKIREVGAEKLEEVRTEALDELRRRVGPYSHNDYLWIAEYGPIEAAKRGTVEEPR